MKKKLYITLVTLLMILLAFIFHSVTEIYYISSALSKGDALADTKFLGSLYCVLPWWLQYPPFVLAFIMGPYLGQRWWKWIQSRGGLKKK